MQNTIELPKNWQWTTLGEIASLERGKFSPRPRNDPRYFNGKYPWIQTGEVESANKYIRTYQDTLNEFGLSVSRLFPKGTLVITIAATIGAVGILDFDTCMPDSLVGITPKKGVGDTEFLYYLLLFLRQRIRASATQSAQANINLELLRPIKIPLPPIAEQKRIATIAQKADRLRRTRRYTLELSDSYLRSVFLEMFGDLRSYESRELNEICSKIFDCKHYTPRYVPEGIPLIRTNDVTPGVFKFGTTVYVSPEEYEKLTDVNKPTEGDIVFAREGSFGVASYINDNRKYAIGQRMMLLRANVRQVDPIYLSAFINSPQCQENLLKVSMGTTVKRVNVGDVKELKISVPPLPLQQKFAQVVQCFERIRIQQREADRQAEHLFQTILHRAFRGEL